MDEPPNAVRCWEVDAEALALCPRLPRRHRLILGEQVSEAHRQAAERRELLGDIARAQAGHARLPPPRPRVLPTRGVAGDLDAALADVPARKSKALRGAA